MSHIISKITNQEVPYDLLYLADEDDDQIQVYRDKAIFFGAKLGSEIIGMIGVVENSTSELEIVCVAVSEEHQNKRIGTELVEEAIAYAKKSSYKKVIIKTGNSGFKQIYLYQTCGFQYDSINKGYFLKHYKNPIFEKDVQCIDQIILSYRIYSEEEQKQLCNDYWQGFIKQHPEYTDRTYESWHFGYGEHLPNKLLALVRQGTKTATCSALELYDKDEKVPEQGDISILIHGNGVPGCIIETKEIRKKAFRDITEEEARLEGEGDLSLDYWRSAHEWFFNFEYTNAGKTFNKDIPVLFERFEVIYDKTVLPD